MQILTLNTWGTRGPVARRQVLINTLKTLRPDICCLQEVTDESLLNELSYPTRFHAQPGGLATLSRFPAVTHQEVTYQTVSTLEPYRRQVLLVQLQLNPKISLWVVNTHLAWQAADEPTRLAQVKELRQLLEPLKGRILLSGDFNTTADSAAIQQILSAGLRDLFAFTHPGDPGITWDNQNPFIQSHTAKFPDRRIDYLFLHEEALGFLTPMEAYVVCKTPTQEGLYPSDHYGVSAHLTFTNVA